MAGSRPGLAFFVGRISARQTGGIFRMDVGVIIRYCRVAGGKVEGLSGPVISLAWFSFAGTLRQQAF
jgi:hypothetical protein